MQGSPTHQPHPPGGVEMWCLADNRRSYEYFGCGACGGDRIPYSLPDSGSASRIRRSGPPISCWRFGRHDLSTQPIAACVAGLSRCVAELSRQEPARTNAPSTRGDLSDNITVMTAPDYRSRMSSGPAPGRLPTPTASCYPNAPSASV